VRFAVTLGGRVERVAVTGRDGRYRVTLGDEVWDVDARAVGPGAYTLLAGGTAWLVHVVEQEGGLLVEVGGETYAVQIEEETRYSIRTRGAGGAGAGSQTLTAPLPGRVTHVAVAPGDRVAAGDPLVVIEAMKMENEFRATVAGTVTEVRVTPGQAVNAGDILVVIADGR